MSYHMLATLAIMATITSIQYMLLAYVFYKGRLAQHASKHHGHEQQWHISLAGQQAVFNTDSWALQVQHACKQLKVR